MTQQRTIKSWGDFIDIADTLLDVGPPTKTHYLFRGQSDATWDLTPSFHRDAKPSKLSARQLLEIEKAALKEFGTGPSFPATQYVKRNVGRLGVVDHYATSWSANTIARLDNFCVCRCLLRLRTESG
jgi:FRG domain